jgi:hypothetical protein
MTTEQNEAFAAAYRALCEQYPVKQKYRKVTLSKESDRDQAFETARCTGDLFFTKLWSNGIPDKEIEALHTLIYG